ncbi:uncharacterized protein LOC126678286 [Mercurialis annua]|uniref:uncharacterized protein LOC126678286 n=1 Tax=Mercurialis annua TaxID=3986 RepID=UPI00215FCCC8|nr:uncharacterized protein LOC126678286 [Mercurialis annua]
MPPKPNKPLLLYLSADHELLGCMLAYEDEGVERAVYYLGQGLTNTEIRYTDIEKMCLCLYFTCYKLRYYMLPVVVYVLSKTDIIKAVKGQVLADFLSDHPCISLEEVKVNYIDVTTWRMWFDGSRSSQGAEEEIHIMFQLGAAYKVSFALNFECTNNQAEYEALIFGLEILAELGATAIHVWGDSLLVIKQVIGAFKCESELLVRSDNFIANDLDQNSSGYKANFEAMEREAQNLHTGGITIEEVLVGDLYKKVFEGLLFRCIGPKEAMLAATKVHEEIAGAH